MEPRFSLEFSQSKKHYREFGNIHVKHTKSWVIILVCVIILMAINVAFTAFKGKLEIKFLIPTMVFYFYWLFADLYIGTLSYNNANKATRGEPARLTFTQTEMISEQAGSSSKAVYQAFTDVCESDSLFALYTSKTSAILVPKTGFTEGTADGFRDFISQKIGAVRRIPSSKKRRIWGIVLGMAFALAMAAVLWLNNREVQFGNTPYSITLPAAFEEYKNDAFAFSARTKEVQISAFPDEKQTLLDYGITDVKTVDDYADLFAEIYELEDCTRTTLENGTVCLTYTMDYENTTYYYCDALTESSDAFWITEFYCKASAQDKYAPLFLQWANSIRIGE